MPSREPGLCGTAYRWSRVTLGAGFLGWAALLAVDIVFLFIEDEEGIPGRLHGVIIAGLVLAVLCPVVTMLACRLIRGQRRLSALFDRLAAQLDTAEHSHDLQVAKAHDAIDAVRSDLQASMSWVMRRLPGDDLGLTR